MPDSTYPLALPPAGTDVHSLPIERVNQAILFSQLRTAELIEPAGTLIPVTLVPDLIGGGWRVRWGYGTIGALPAGIRAAFADIDRVGAVHLQPATRARVCIDKEAGRLRVAVELPAPELAVPRTFLPADALVLPQGEPLELSAELPDGQYLVVLRASEDRVEMLVDDRVIAVLEGADAARVSPRLAGIGLPGARVFSLDGRVLLDVGPGQPQSVPALPAPPEPEPEPVPVVLDGPWAVTMTGEDVEEPAPAGTRPLKSPVVD